jgi:hypothetical protein
MKSVSRLFGWMDLAWAGLLTEVVLSKGHEQMEPR